MKINGYSIPLKDIVLFSAAGMWLGALSFQVNANGDEIQEHSETKERIALLEAADEVVKGDISDIKDEQKSQGKEQIEQGKILAKILEKVSER